MPPWQDLVLTVGSIFLSLGLLASITSEDKPSVWTSVTTVLCMVAFGAVDVSLRLYGAMAAQGFGGVLWAILAVQVLQKHRQTRILK